MNPRRQIFDMRRKKYKGIPIGDNGVPITISTESIGGGTTENNKVSSEELEQAKSQYTRLRAEFDNYQKRVKREEDKIKKYANENLIKKLITVVDDVDRALDSAKNTENVQALVDGINIIREHFWQQLTAEGLEKIPTEGVPFNPEVHEAVSTEQHDTIEENHVVSTYQSGYKLNDRVIRAAMVTVSKKG